MSNFVNEPFPEGTISHRYKLLEALGSGGYASVWKSQTLKKINRNVEAGELVAVKIFKQRFTSPDVARKFQDEAGRLSRLNDPNIIKLLDFGIERDFPYIVMPLAQETLEKRHPLGERLSGKQIVNYVSQISRGLDYIHRFRLAHGDLTPVNVLCIKRDNKDTLLLSDFGLAQKILSTSRTSGTMRNLEVVEIEGIKTLTPSEKEELIRIAGTYPYMAPEQFKGPLVSAESDQYALAIMVYRWICGEPPFNVSNPNKIASSELYRRYEHLHIDMRPESLRERVPELPAKVDEVVRKALSKNRKERFGSILEFEQALRAAFYHKTTVYPSRRRVVVGGGIAAAGTILGAVVAAQYLKLIRLPVLSPPDDSPSPQSIIYTGHTANIRSLAWSPDDNYMVSSSDDGTAQIWDSRTSATQSTYRKHSAHVAGVAWSPDGELVASSSADGTVQIWDALTGTYHSTYKGHIETYPGPNTQKGEWLSRISWSPNGQYIASGDQIGDNTKEAHIHVWDVKTLKRVVTYRGHMNGFFSVAWSPDGSYIASSGYDKSLQIWEGLTGKLITKYSGNSNLFGLSWSPDNKYVAVGSSSQEMWIIDAHSGHVVNTYTSDGALEIPDVSWSSDNDYIAIGKHIAINNTDTIAKGLGSVEVLSKSLDPTRTLYDDDTGIISAIAWSHDAKRIAFGDAAGAVKIRTYFHINP